MIERQALYCYLFIYLFTYLLIFLFHLGFFFFSVLGLEHRAFTLSHSTNPIFAKSFSR
jgi:hypothetical protein